MIVFNTACYMWARNGANTACTTTPLTRVANDNRQLSRNALVG